MVLDLPCSEATATGGGGVGIDIDIVVVGAAVISSSGMVGHEVKVLLQSASEGVPEAPASGKEGVIPRHHSAAALCAVYELVIKANHGSMRETGCSCS